MRFDNRIAVEEVYDDRYAPMSEKDRRDFDSVNRSIVVFGWLVVLLGVIGFAMIVIGTIEHLNR